MRMAVGLGVLGVFVLSLGFACLAATRAKVSPTYTIHQYMIFYIYAYVFTKTYKQAVKACECNLHFQAVHSFSQHLMSSASTTTGLTQI